MSEDEEVSRSKSRRLSRRTMLRLGLLAIPASQVPLGLVPHARAQGTKLGANLIGKLEGAEVVTDPALYPKSFKEAPQLAELVKAGKLPPVQERIGQDPLVIKPLREVGKYGGTWRRGFTGPYDTSNGHRAAQNDKLRAAEQEDALAGPVGRLSDSECLVAEPVVDVVEERAVTGVQLGRGGRSLAAVEPPARDAELGQLTVGRPPPGAHDRIGEVEVALALAIVGAPPRALARSAIALVEQISVGLGLGKERGLLVEHGVLVSDDLEMLLSRLVDHCGRIPPEGRLKAEMAHAAVPALGLAVGREIDQAVAGNSLLANRPRKPTQLLGVVEVAGRLQESQRSAGREGRPAEQLGYFEHDST
jgi:hypothetical protein